MTRYSDNIYSGFVGVTSALSSRSAVLLTKTFNFSSTVGSTTLTGVFPPNTQNLAARIYITQNGSATSSNKITVSAGGTNLLTVDQFGSAGGYANTTTAGIARFTVIGSACATVSPPATNQTNGGEIPFSVTFVKSSADKTGACQLSLLFNRADTAPTDTP